eukprot:gene58556-78108_t
MGNGVQLPSDSTILTLEQSKTLAGKRFDAEVFRKFAKANGTLTGRELILLGKFAYDAFLTHDWGINVDKRDNHQYVARINAELKSYSLKPWFDNEQMTGCIVDQMFKGIDTSQLVLVFITQRYRDKLASENAGDNCRKEFMYADTHKTSKYMIPVVMETAMKDQKSWTGPL